VSTPTATPPAWLEAAAKLDALLGEKVPVSAAKAEPADEVDSEFHEDPSAELREEEDSEGEDREGEAPAEPFALAARQEPRPPAEAQPRPRITPPVVIPAPAGDAAEETDLAWQGYAPFALLPSTLALAAATAVVTLAVRPFVPARVLHEAVDAPLAAAWLLVLVPAAYRLMAYNYRLTTRRLFRERGRLYTPEPPLDLATVVTVAAEQSRFERWLGVGTVRAVAENGPPWALTGVRRPALLADMICDAAKATREGNITAARAEMAADVARQLDGSE
jgi:hypothetical protein